MTSPPIPPPDPPPPGAPSGPGFPVSPRMPPGASPPKKSSGCTGCLIGCAIVAVLLVAALGGGGFYLYSNLMKRKNQGSEEFQARGFKVEKGDELIVSQTVEANTLLDAPIVTLNADAGGDLAIVAFQAEVHSTVKGNLYFRGGALRIGPDARILGDVDADCWAVSVEGYVQGKVTGKFLAADEARRKHEAPEGVETPDEPTGPDQDDETPGEEMPPPAEPTPSQPNPPAHPPPAVPPAPAPEPPPAAPADPGVLNPAEPTPPDPHPVPPSPAPPPEPPPSQ